MSKFMNRPPPVISTAQTTSSAFVEKIMIGLDHAPAAFDLRGQLIGAGGANLHYIRNETGAIATLRGRGSLFIEPSLGVESMEPMHLYIEHTRFDGLQSAKQLAKNLIETLQQELIHFQQINPPVPTVQYTQQTTSQMSVPPPMLAVPPPVIQSNTVDQLSSASQQTQATMQTVTTQQPTILQHQTIIPQNMPIHLHQSIPPPNIHTIPVKQTPMHIQGPPLSQPPPNIQLQQPQTTQIVLNQPQSNYQYQYIQPNDGSQQQVTIQHIYQPQGIVQTTTQPATHLNQFATSQALRPPQSQQYIVQGTTYMVPPPNIIQHQPPPVAQSQTQQPNIIFQTAPPQPGQLLQQIQFQPPPNIVDSTISPIITEDTVKEEKTTLDLNETSIKTEDRSTDRDENGSPNSQQLQQQMQQPPPTVSMSLQTQHMQVRPPQYSSAPTISTVTQVPPPIMAVPPPMTIVGNTLIATSQAAQTQQIYNQPVSIQQIQAPQQQIHVSTPNGQHFLVNAQQWQPHQHQFQQISQNGNIQGFQLTTPQQQTIITPQNQNAEMRTIQSQQHILTTAFNPHIPAPTVTGMMQVQLQPLPSQQITIDNHNHQQQIIDQNTLHAPPPPPPPSITYQQIQTVRPATHVVDGQFKMNLSAYPQQVSSPQPVPYPTPIHEKQLRPGQKRKRDSSTDDDSGQPHHILPRMGMGLNNGGQFLNNQRDIHPSTSNAITNTNSLSIVTTTCAGLMTTANSQDESNVGENVIQSNNNIQNIMEQANQQQQPSSVPTNNNNSGMNSMAMPPRGMPRFHANNNQRGDFSHVMRLPPPHRFGPPPPPPPPGYARMQQSRFRAQW